MGRRIGGLAEHVAADDPHGSGAVGVELRGILSVAGVDAEALLCEHRLDGVGAGEGVEEIGAVGVAGEEVGVVEPVEALHGIVTDELVAHALGEGSRVGVAAGGVAELQRLDVELLLRGEGEVACVERHRDLAQLVALERQIALSVLRHVVVGPAEAVLAVGRLEVALEGVVGDVEQTGVGVVVALGHSHLVAVGRDELQVGEVRPLHLEVYVLDGLPGGHVLEGESHLRGAVGHEAQKRHVQPQPVVARRRGAHADGRHRLVAVAQFGRERGQVVAFGVGAVDDDVDGVAHLGLARGRGLDDGRALGVYVMIVEVLAGAHAPHGQRHENG